jgi:hypothetical protein
VAPGAASCSLVARGCARQPPGPRATPRSASGPRKREAGPSTPPAALPGHWPIRKVPGEARSRRTRPSPREGETRGEPRRHGAAAAELEAAAPPLGERSRRSRGNRGSPDVKRGARSVRPGPAGRHPPPTCVIRGFPRQPQPGPRSDARAAAAPIDAHPCRFPSQRRRCQAAPRCFTPLLRQRLCQRRPAAAEYDLMQSLLTH